MIVKDQNVLEQFRGWKTCEWCGSVGPVEGHHYWFKRGIGGGSRLDHPYNLVSVCRGFKMGIWRSCHDSAENGKITKEEFLKIVARREGKTPQEIVMELVRIRNLPKGSEL